MITAYKATHCQRCNGTKDIGVFLCDRCVDSMAKDFARFGASPAQRRRNSKGGKAAAKIWHSKPSKPRRKRM